jgi:hypothetical protein
MPKVLFRVIRAKPVNWQPFYNEVAKTLDAEVKPALLAYFEKVTKSWVNEQTFKAKKRITQTMMTVDVWPSGPNAKIWGYVTNGNPTPYRIPKLGNTKAKTLRFTWGGKGSYKARTTPQGGYKGPGKATGNTTYRKFVTHPVVPGRHFEKHIARWYNPQFRRTMKNAVARGLRAAKK